MTDAQKQYYIARIALLTQEKAELLAVLEQLVNDMGSDSMKVRDDAQLIARHTVWKFKE